MSAIAEFATFVVAPRPLDDAAGAAVRLHLIDTLGALIASAGTPEGRLLLRFRGEAGGQSDPATTIGTLCALARLSEIDDIHLAAMTTPGSIVIPAALAIAASRPVEDWDAIGGAILAGYEAMVRLGQALNGPAVLYRGIWPTYIATPFAVAAVAARLFGLDAKQAAQALALALSYAAPGVGHHNAATTSRWVAVGQAARSGLAAARAAGAGFTADTDILDGGFFSGIYGFEPKPAALTDALGRRDVLAEVSFKPWCAARQTMAAAQALKELLAEGIRADDIVSVTAAIPPPHRKMVDHGVTPGNRAAYLTSLQYNMAVAARAPALADVLSPKAADVPEGIGALMQKITVEADDALLADYPRLWPAQVTVTTASETRARRIAAIPGDPSQPFGEAEVIAKFRRFATPAIGEAGANALLNAIHQSPAALLQQIERVIAA